MKRKTRGGEKRKMLKWALTAAGNLVVLYSIAQDGNAGAPGMVA
jgi:hypothetical protein